ncbi:MAG: amino acid ABC transporter permease [Candidatus Puniceispirillales bacterium WSBS_2018_MAG_OTU23]
MRSGKSLLLALIYDTRYRSITFQVLLLLSIVLGFWWIIDNTVTNLAAQSKSVGFNFFSQTAGFQINPTLGTWLLNFESGKSTYLDVFYIGIVNTLLIAFFGIIAATILGFTLGVMRLSQNFVFRATSTVFIEVTRNIPLLVQLFFWYFTVLRSLPKRQEKLELIPDLIGINITGLYMPAAIPETGFNITAWAFLAAVIIMIATSRWAKKRQAATGQIFPIFWAGLGIFIALPLAAFMVTGAPLTWEVPVFVETGAVLRRGFQQGLGIFIIPEMLAVWFALTIYTSGFIAEIVRAGIVAVHKGQTEASCALGLKRGFALRLVIIPQAMRIIIPPLTSQYLNLTKNSSLAAAIAYPELVSVFAGTALNQAGREIEIIFITMAVYLAFSITTATLMNWFNAKFKLVER